MKPPAHTRLQEAAALTGSPPRPLILGEPRIHHVTYPDKETQAERHTRWLGTVPNTATVIYTDGSKSGQGAGWAIAAYRAGRLVRTHKQTVRGAEFYDTEMSAINGAIQAVAKGTRTKSTSVRTTKQPYSRACVGRPTAPKGRPGPQGRY